MVESKGDTVMKKLMSLMLGLSIALGSFALFAQDTTSTTKTEKIKKKAKKTVKKETTKTEEKQN
jgi:uncharacterized protein YlxW (UPF0749 family)